MKLALALLLTALAGLVRAEDTLYLYNWNNYISADTAARFEAWCGCRLKQDYYSDNEEMLAKLEAGATGYDLLVPTGNAVQTLIRKNELRPLDDANLESCGLLQHLRVDDLIHRTLALLLFPKLVTLLEGSKNAL